MGSLIHVNDLPLMNCIAKEVNKLAGMFCYYYRLDKENTKRKAIYDEIEELAFLDTPNGLKMPCLASEPSHSVTTSEEGRRKQWDGELWIARADWEDVITEMSDNHLHKADSTSILGPRIGDILYAWDLYYDVIDVSRDGVVDDDRRIYTLHKLSIRRMVKFEAWRRIETP